MQLAGYSLVSIVSLFMVRYTWLIVLKHLPVRQMHVLPITYYCGSQCGSVRVSLNTKRVICANWWNKMWVNSPPQVTTIGEVLLYKTLIKRSPSYLHDTFLKAGRSRHHLPCCLPSLWEWEENFVLQSWRYLYLQLCSSTVVSLHNFKLNYLAMHVCMLQFSITITGVAMLVALFVAEKQLANINAVFLIKQKNLSICILESCQFTL